MVGKFATSKAGHDKNQLYVVVDADEEFAYLCDGRLKPIDSPKKKRFKHIQIINKSVEENLLVRLANHEKVMNEEIKYAIKHYN